MNKPTQQSVLWIFDVKALDLPDQDLGIQLLSDWLFYQAEKRGVNPARVTLEFAGKVRRSTAAIKDADLENPDNAPLLMALRLVARGEAAAGGALFRRHMHRGALRLRNERDATKGRKAKAQQTGALGKGRRAGAHVNRIRAKDREEALIAAIDKVISLNVAPHAQKIARAINKNHSQFFPNGAPYAASTITRKVAEIMTKRRKAADKK